MHIVEMILTAIGLSSDAFSVAICKGLSIRRLNFIQAGIIALFFGGFQALMPAIGFLIVKTFEDTEEFQIYITSNAALIAFILLLFLGLKMLWDAFKDKSKKDVERAEQQKRGHQIANLNLLELLFLAIATSIDALMTGFAFACMQMDMIFACSIIGSVAFIMSFAGVFIGHFFGAKWERPATIAGGIILILIGVKFLLDYLGVA